MPGTVRGMDVAASTSSRWSAGQSERSVCVGLWLDVGGRSCPPVKPANLPPLLIQTQVRPKVRCDTQIMPPAGPWISRRSQRGSMGLLFIYWG